MDVEDFKKLKKGTVLRDLVTGETVEVTEEYNGNDLIVSMCLPPEAAKDYEVDP